MGKNYTIKYNRKGQCWEPERIRAGLVYGSATTDEPPSKEKLMHLSPEFKVEDAADIPVGFTGGIASNVLSIEGKTLVEMGKLAEFHVGITVPKTPQEKAAIGRVLSNQMDFPLKITLYPLTTFMPGIPVNVMSAMVNRAADSVHVYVEVPPDKLTIDPPDNPIIVDSRANEPITLTARCDKLNLETMGYEVAKDNAGNPILPNVDMKDADQHAYFVEIKKEKDTDSVQYSLIPRRFVVGDGTPLECAFIYIRCPKSFNHADPNQVKVGIGCGTSPVEADFRVYRGSEELCRKTVKLVGELLDINVTSKSKSMDWRGVDLAWQIRSPGTFYTKSHLDMGRISLAEQQFAQIYLTKDESAVTKDFIDIEVEEEVADGTLFLSKCGWEPIDEKLEDLFPDAGAEIADRLNGAVLEVTCEAVFEALRGDLRMDLKGLDVKDFTGILTWKGKQISGQYRDGKLVFTPEGKLKPGKIASLHLKMMPEGVMRDTLEEIQARTYSLDPSLSVPFQKYATEFVRYLANERNETLGANLQELYAKLNGYELMFGKMLILRKEQEFSFDLRAKAAAQIINNVIGLLIEMTAGYIQLRSERKAIEARGGKTLQETLEWHQKARKVARVPIDDKISLAAKAQKGVIQAEKELASAKQKMMQIIEETDQLMWKLRTENTTANQQLLLELRKALEVSKLENEAFEAALAAQKKLAYELSLKVQIMERAYEKGGEPLREVLKEVYDDKVTNTAVSKAAEEVAKEVFKQDAELLTELHLQRTKTSSMPMFESLNNILTSTSLTAIKIEYLSEPPSVLSLIADVAYTKFVNEATQAMGKVTDALWDLIRQIPTRLSEVFRDWSWVNHVVNQPYRSTYTEYPKMVAAMLPTQMSDREKSLFSGQFVIDEVSKEKKPDKEWQERAMQIWREEDRQNRQSWHEQLLALAQYALELGPDSSGGPDLNRWTRCSATAIETVGNAVDQLLSLIRDYEASFDNEKKFSKENNRSWQHIDNLLNEITFYLGWSIRLLSWAALYTGVGTALAIPLSTASELVDRVGAGLQVGVSYVLTLPEINGIVEAIPLLAAMLHHTVTEKGVTMDSDILDF